MKLAINIGIAVVLALLLLSRPVVLSELMHHGEVKAVMLCLVILTTVRDTYLGILAAVVFVVLMENTHEGMKEDSTDKNKEEDSTDKKKKKDSTDKNKKEDDEDDADDDNEKDDKKGLVGKLFSIADKAEKKTANAIV